MGVKEYFIFAFPNLVLELMAALAGTFYLKKIPACHVRTKYFVRYLWMVFLLDATASYAPIGYFSNYQYFSFVKDTIIAKSHWLSNLYVFLTPLFIGYYYLTLMKQNISKRIIRIFTAVFVIIATVNFIGYGAFFNWISPWVSLSGAFLVFTTIMFYFFELLRSDSILNLKYHLPIYVAVGILIFYLCISPLTIFSNNFSVGSGNKLFVDLQVYIILFSNIFMYSCFTLGFLLCSRKKKYS